MPSNDHPFPVQNPAEMSVNRQALDGSQREGGEADPLLPLSEGNTSLAPGLVLAQVRRDLTTAGMYVAPPEPLTDEEQGGVVVYINHDAHVVVDWMPHTRLTRAALEMVEADHTDAEDAIRYEAVRSSMDTALGSILAGFGYSTGRPQSGRGHIIAQAPAVPDVEE